MNITLPTPINFDFKRTVISHGWCELLPFERDREKWKITRVIDLGKHSPVTILVTARKRALNVELSRRLSKAATDKVLRDVRHMLRLDDDLRVFFRTVK